MVDKKNYFMFMAQLAFVQSATFNVMYANVGSGKIVRNMGAAVLAAREIAKENILGEHVLNITYTTFKKSENANLYIMAKALCNGVMAFFGPLEYCTHEGRLAGGFNTPIFATLCRQNVGSDRTSYPTFLRFYSEKKYDAEVITSVLLKYNWNKFTIVKKYEEFLGNVASDWTEVEVSLKKYAKIYNLTLNDDVSYTQDKTLSNDTKLRAEMAKTILSTYKRTRVYVHLAPLQDIITFKEIFNELIKEDNNLYVFLSMADVQRNLYKEEFPDRFLMQSRSDAMDTKDKAIQDKFLNETKIVLHNQLFLTYRLGLTANFETWSALILNITNQNRGVDVSSYFTYDSVKVWAEAMSEVIKEGGDVTNGTDITRRVLGKSFKSSSGVYLYMDDNGEVHANFTFLSLQENGNSPAEFKPAGVFLPKTTSSNGLPVFNETYEVFPAGVPLAEPICGYDNQHCMPPKDITVSIVCGVFGGLLLLSLIVAIVVLRKYRYEQQLASLIWKINLTDLQLKGKTDKFVSMHSMVTMMNNGGSRSGTSFKSITELSNTAFYKGNVVHIQWIEKKSVNITRKIKLELKQMRDIRHGHLIMFLGACVEPAKICIVTEYCSKGSLQDILENDDIQLDHMFIASIVTDIVKGMLFVHASDIKTHGNLRSSTCMVDSRWVIKLGEFGLHHFKDGDATEVNYAYYRDRLWVAPELLRDGAIGGTQKGDVYAFSVILYEIFGRSGPYGDIDFEPQEIVQKVMKDGSSEIDVFRPDLASLPPEVKKKYIYAIALMMDCWNEDPEKRPDFRACKSSLKPIRQGLKPNIFDNMMAIMESYANNLEGLVKDRTSELVEEKKKTETLLHRMLPRSVVDQLKRGESVRPEAYDSVSIYFSDICGFTAMSAASSPLQVVDLLNDLYVLFDSTIKSFDVYKVETIGDAYMVVSGLPDRNGLNHAGEIASMSLKLQGGIMKFSIRHMPDEVLKLRIGIHSGPCVAGVVGVTMPRYCLFGDTVNTASRMESNGLPLKIHVSPECKDVLDELRGYVTEERGYVEMKGKGKIQTYWLLSEDISVREQRMTNKA